LYLGVAKQGTEARAYVMEGRAKAKAIQRPKRDCDHTGEGLE
jgi:hypothetical protein